MVALMPDSRRYGYRVIEALVGSGWTLRRVPTAGRLPFNRMLLQLVTPEGDGNFRFLLYSISGTGRGKAYERRIEITSTYVGGSLPELEGTEDVVLGYERHQDLFVGFDSRRLHHGGVTENASSFFDIEGLRLANDNDVVVLARESELFGIEYHAFFKPPRLAEYLFNLEAIHEGSYRGLGKFSRHHLGRVRGSGGRLTVPDQYAFGDMVVLESPRRGVPPRTRRNDVEALERADLRPLRRSRRKVTPEELEIVRKRAEENGLLGEKLVLDEERRRLRAGGRADLADNVRWVSRESVAAGFDISSYEIDGTERFVEVKTTEGTAPTFQITANEWLVAARQGDKYVIARVTDVRGQVNIDYLRNPAALVAAGKLRQRATGWTLTILY